jgi:hypothetical protein
MVRMTTISATKVRCPASGPCSAAGMCSTSVNRYGWLALTKLIITMPKNDPNSSV